MVSVSCHPDTANAADRATYPTVGNRRVQILREAGTRWHAKGVAGAQALLGDAAGSREASPLLARTLSTATQEGYQRHWEAFTRYCQAEHLSALPALPYTISCYIGTLFTHGTIRGGSLRPYVAATGTQHFRFGLQEPCTDPLVVATRQVYRRQDAARTSGAPLRSATLPAPLAARALHITLASPSTRDLQHWGLIALGFLLCGHPTSIRNLCRLDVKLAEDDITLQMRVFKYGETGFTPRIALRIPLGSGPETAGCIYTLIASLVRATTAPHFWLFPSTTDSQPASAASVATALSLLTENAAPPPGSQFTARSLRSGGISAAYAAGVPLLVIMRLSSHHSEAVVHKHYLDALMPSTPAARLFFARFTCSAGSATTGPGLANWQFSAVGQDYVCNTVNAWL